MFRCRDASTGFSLYRLAHTNVSRYRKKTAADYALDHFDNYYAKLFGKQWPSLRVALLSPNKYCAVINRHSQIRNRTVERLREGGAFELLDESRKLRLLENVQSSRQRLLGEQAAKSASVNEKDDSSKQVAESSNANTQSSRVHTLMRTEHAEAIRDDRTNLSEFVPVTEIVSENELIIRSKKHTLVESGDDTLQEPEGDAEAHSMGAAGLHLIPDDPEFSIPSKLSVYTFPRSDFTRFTPAQADSANRLEYYVLDTASLLPVLALNVPRGASVLDMCSGPGGKAFCINQTGAAHRLMCIDSRHARIQRVINTFRLYSTVSAGEDYSEHPQCLQMDSRNLPFENTFDRVLCDVPCSADRHALEMPETNLFVPSRYRERLRLTDLQSDLLMSALKSVKPGGYVVYSTCTLSAVQNDGVILNTISRAHTETNMRVALVNLTPLRQTFVDVFRFAPSQYGTGHAPVARCGLLVVPFLPVNHGPMFVSKLRRLQ